ncbi:MAG: PHB depolymerase family esterase [Chloroflexota bacterium]
MESPRRRKWAKVGCIALILLLIAIPLVILGAIGKSPACYFPDNGPVEPGLSIRTIHSDGRERCYTLYAPAQYDPTHPLPLILSLHGFAGNASGLRDMTGWDALAESEGFLVVYPEGSSFPLRWNTTPAANIEEVDDVQFIRDLLAELSAVAAVDPARIFVTGFSNGGGMSHRLACRLADQIAAVGLVSGLDPREFESCQPSRPVPVISFYGTADPLVQAQYPPWFQALINVSLEKESLPEGNPETWFRAWAEEWNGCVGPAENFSRPGVINGLRYTACPENAEAILYPVEGHGHAWPGGPSVPFLGSSSTTVQASQLMWEFFSQHPLR